MPDDLQGSNMDSNLIAAACQAEPDKPVVAVRKVK